MHTVYLKLLLEKQKSIYTNIDTQVVKLEHLEQNIRLPSFEWFKTSANNQIPLPQWVRQENITNQFLYKDVYESPMLPLQQSSKIDPFCLTQKYVVLQTATMILIHFQSLKYYNVIFGVL